jgi:signal transduction histidine kinase
VFDPPVRENGQRLSIVRAIATAHGATLTAHAQVHGGLIVQVTFEAAQDA